MSTTTDTRADLLDVDLGGLAGRPPARPPISAEARAIAAEVYELDRRQQVLESSGPLLAVLIGALESLWAGAAPASVARRVAAACDLLDHMEAQP